MESRISIQLNDLVMLKAEARGFSLLPRQPVGSLLAGRHASRLRGRGLSFEELRRYQSGDDIRNMDWKATARLRSPYVRVYNEERERPVLLVVDQRSPMFFGSARVMKSVAAAQLAALAAWRVLEAGDRIGGIVLSDRELIEVRPHRSKMRLLRLFHEIVRCNQSLAANDKPQAERSLNEGLRAALRVAKHDHLVVVISDLDGANDETEHLATQLAAHNDVLIAAIYDPLGIALSGAPGMLAFDRGKVCEVPSGSTFSKDFQDTFQKLLDKWTQLFHSLRVPVLPISAARPVAEQVRVLFGSR